MQWIAVVHFVNPQVFCMGLVFCIWYAHAAVPLIFIFGGTNFNEVEIICFVITLIISLMGRFVLVLKFPLCICTRPVHLSAVDNCLTIIRYQIHLHQSGNSEAWEEITAFIMAFRVTISILCTLFSVSWVDNLKLAQQVFVLMGK